MRKIVNVKPANGGTTHGVAESCCKKGMSVFTTKTMPKIGPQTFVSGSIQDTIANTEADHEAIGLLLILNPSSQTAESSMNQSGEDITIKSASGNPSNSATTLSKFLKDAMNQLKQRLLVN
jgi:hypothetical protein